MRKFYSLLLVAFAALGLNAQVTTEPFPLQESSQNVTVFFHADEGNKGLMGAGADIKLYAHTWATLQNGQQVGAPNWNAAYPEKFQLVYVGKDLWRLNIGDIRTFYGVTGTSPVVQLGFVFRDASGNQTGRAEGGADILVDVIDEGLQVVLQSSVQGYLITPFNQNVTFTATTTENASISISVNGTSIATGSGKQLKASYDFAQVGDYEVIATASAGGKTVTATKEYCYVKASAEVPYPGGGKPKMGPVRNADGSVTFCLGAPLKSSVMIVGAWNDYAIENDQVMNYTDYNNMRYFWITIPALDYDKMYGYYFIVDGSTMVGDPYARLVLDPWNDKYISTNVYPGLPAYPFDKIDGVPLAIYQGNINDYDWKVKNFHGPDAKDLIIYELLFRDFTGTEGRANGNGTVRQAIEKFDYLLDLGVNAIELLPIMEFNGNNSWGYNPNFYFAPDKAYGTPDDYKEFIDLCHQHGIAVILDMVFNQSDGLHPWYQMYMPGQNPFYNLNAPHAYSVLNDWNQGFEMVQEQWRDVLRYWLEEYKFDGYRFDLVKGLGNNSSYPNNGDQATNAYNQSRINRMIGFNELIKEINPYAYCINEDLATAREENAMAEHGMLNWANVNEEACQFAMGYKSGSGLNRLYAPLDDNRLLNSTVSYLESHDEQRLAYKQNMWGVSGVKGNTAASMQRCGSAAAQMIMTPGAHMIWQFSEMGNAQSTKNDMGNDTSPKIVNWNLLNDPDHRGLYENYCELIAIRNQNPEMFSDYAYFDIKCGEDNWEQGRRLVSTLEFYELYTFVNPNVDSPLTFSVNFIYDSDSDYQIMSKSYGSEPSFDAAARTVTVPANCYVVIGSKELLGVNDAAVTEGSLNALRAYGASGEIVVQAASAPVEIYTVDGLHTATVEQGATVSAVPGIYILRSGSETVKLAVH